MDAERRAKIQSREERRKVIQDYKQQEQVGGIYRIVNLCTGETVLLQATQNIAGQRNKLQFAKKTNCCCDRALEKQWAQYGGEAFDMQVLETLKKKPDQSTVEFKDDLALLLELWEKK